MNPTNPTPPTTGSKTVERIAEIQLVAGPDGTTPPPIYVDVLGSLVNRENDQVPLEVLGFTSRNDSTVVELPFENAWHKPDLGTGTYAVLLFPDYVVRTSMYVTETIRFR